MTGVLLQTRLSSTRLPGKALLAIGEYTIVEHCMRSLRRLPVAHHVLVTCEESASALRPLAERHGFELFVGSESDVLERFVFAARRYDLDEIVRATGDNPLVSWELARMVIAMRRRHGVDYAAYDGPPLGTGVEVVRADALEKAYRESQDPYDHEHVTPYVYRNPDRFKCWRVDAPQAYRAPDFHVTIDTPEDFRHVSGLFKGLYDGSPIPILRLVNHARTASSTEAHAHPART